mmetsp:Transcript_124172/g.397424  ORF Transcript_124172/g.397424 Transcript_124172/m.397424 type:complete len:371 (-) Transcript_124172:1155-2267(-)
MFVLRAWGEASASQHFHGVRDARLLVRCKADGSIDPRTKRLLGAVHIPRIPLAALGLCHQDLSALALDMPEQVGEGAREPVGGEFLASGRPQFLLQDAQGDADPEDAVQLARQSRETTRRQGRQRQHDAASATSLPHVSVEDARGLGPQATLALSKQGSDLLQLSEVRLRPNADLALQIGEIEVVAGFDVKADRPRLGVYAFDDGGHPTAVGLAVVVDLGAGRQGRQLRSTKVLRQARRGYHGSRDILVARAAVFPHILASPHDPVGEPCRASNSAAGQILNHAGLGLNFESSRRLSDTASDQALPRARCACGAAVCCSSHGGHAGVEPDVKPFAEGTLCTLRGSKGRRFGPSGDWPVPADICKLRRIAE